MQQKRSRQTRWWDDLRPLNIRAVAQVVATLGAGFGEPVNSEMDVCFTMRIQEGSTFNSGQVERILMYVHDFEVNSDGFLAFHYEKDKVIDELQAIMRKNSMDRRNTIFKPKLEHVSEDSRKTVGDIMRAINDNILVAGDCIAIMPRSGEFGVDANFNLCLGTELHALGRELHEPYTVRFTGSEFRIVVV